MSMAMHKTVVVSCSRNLAVHTVSAEKLEKNRANKRRAETQMNNERKYWFECDIFCAICFYSAVRCRNAPVPEFTF